MAEVTAMRNNALPYPVYGAPFTIVVPVLDADGDPIAGATGLDSEVSKNGDTFADCTNEATEIATSSGLYYLSLTGAEMTADVVTVQVKTSSSGGKTTPVVLYPRKLVSLRSGTSQTGAAGSITLDSNASAVDDTYNGCLIVGTLDSTTEARIISDYVGSTKVASVTPNWNTTPDSDDTFVIYLVPEAQQVMQSDMRQIEGIAPATHGSGYVPSDVRQYGGSAGTFSSGRPEVNTSHFGGTAGTFASGRPEVNTSHFGGSAGTFASGRPEVNTTHWKGTAAATVDTAGYPVVTVKDGTGAGEIALTGGAVDTVTTLTNAPSDSAGVTTLLSRVPSGIFTGITSLAQWLGLMAGKQTGNSTARTEIRATGAGSGTYDETTDSQEATRDNMTTPPTAAAIADQVWEETLADHSGTSGSTAAALNAAGSAGDPWNTALPGAYGAGSAGKILGDNLNATVSSRLATSGYTAPLDAAATRSAVGLASANLDTQLDALPTNAELSTALAAADDAVLAAIAALNNLSAAQVTAAVPTATQNADALLKRDFSAVTGEASRSALNALRFLRNKWAIAGGTLSVKKEDDSTEAWAGAVTQTAGDPVSEIDPA